MSEPKNYLENVRGQYEDLPYPPRNLEDEHNRIMVLMDNLPWINHACFGGRQNFDENFRMLVAGGGTGDAVIYHGEEMKKRGGKIVYVDISQASMAIAKERAKIRGLDNIEWHHASLLDIPKMGLGTFDFINCIGVLHHLEDPDAGLNALTQVLKDDGAMSIMLYATYGRTVVYHIQTLMRMLNYGEEDKATKIENLKQALSAFPQESWRGMSKGFINYKKDEETDIGLYDLYLHDQDRSYTIVEVHDWLDKQGLSLVDDPGPPQDRVYYQPETFIKEQKMLRKIKELPRKYQHGIAEIYCGRIATHNFFARKKPAPVLTFGGENEDLIPFIYMMKKEENGDLIANALERSIQTGEMLDIRSNKRFIKMRGSKLNAALFAALDGKRSIRQIINKVTSSSEITEDPKMVAETFASLCNLFHSKGWLFLRHKDVTPFRYIQEMHKPA